MNRKWIVIAALIVMVLTVGSCTKDMTIFCHAETTDLKVDGKKLDDMVPGDEVDVEVPGVGTFVISWTNRHGAPDSETIEGRDVEEGAIWHLYTGYGEYE